MVLLENCRMNVGEKADDEALSRRYAALCDVFVMDAFGTAHRAQASTHGAIRFAKQAAGGPLLMAELDALAKALQDPARPLLAIVAGSKVSTKLELLSSLVGKSLVEMDLIDTAKQIMADAKARGADIPLPVDVVVAPAFAADAPATIKGIGDVGADDMILDIGPDTAQAYADLIAKAGTVVWNGPVGVFRWWRHPGRGGQVRHRGRHLLHLHRRRRVPGVPGRQGIAGGGGAAGALRMKSIAMSGETSPVVALC